MNKYSPIGVFDSGVGGLSVLKHFVHDFPEYDFLYLGDNARAPYGSRSFETVYEYTLECVEYLFSQGCELVILACNTASAKALRTIQQNDLRRFGSGKRVLGVIRPSAEFIGSQTQSNKVGVLATLGTVNSNSYEIEITNFSPNIKVFQLACPLWVPLIENGLHNSDLGKEIIKKDVNELMHFSSDIDVVLLGCTHYPILKDFIQNLVGDKVKVVAQGEIVSEKLRDYLFRHKELDEIITKNGTIRYLTTDVVSDFDKIGSTFMNSEIKSEHITL